MLERVSQTPIMILVVSICAFFTEQALARVNLALNKPASESSSYSGSNAEKANDGNRVGQYLEGTCTSTTQQESPWWTVDLEGNYSIDSLRIYNRNDQGCIEGVHCKERLAGFRVHVSDQVSDTVPSTRFKHLCHSDQQTPVPAIIDVNCTSTLVGRYVTISLKQASPQYLSLCEVEVYGHNISSDTVVISTVTTQASSTNTNLHVELSATSLILAPDTNKPVSSPQWTTCLTYKSSEKQSVLETTSPLDMKSITDNTGYLVFPSYDITKGSSFLLEILTTRAAEVTVSDDVSTGVSTSKKTNSTSTGVSVPEMTIFDASTGVSEAKMTAYDKVTSEDTSTGVSVPEMTIFDASTGVSEAKMTAYDKVTSEDTSTGVSVPEMTVFDASTGVSEAKMTAYDKVTPEDTSTCVGVPELMTCADAASGVIVPEMMTYDDASTVTHVSVPQMTTYDGAPTAISVPQMTTYDRASTAISVPQMTTYDGASTAISVPQMTTYDSASTAISVPQMTTYDSASTAISVSAMTIYDTFKGVDVTETTPPGVSVPIYPEYRRSATEGLLMSTRSCVSDQSQTLMFLPSSIGVKNMCRCSFRKQMFAADQTSDKFMLSVLKELDIDRKNVTKERRRYISVPDERKSSIAIGGSFLAIVLPVCGIILCDLNKVMRDINRH